MSTLFGTFDFACQHTSRHKGQNQKSQTSNALIQSTNKLSANFLDTVAFVSLPI